jgi:hypothetical protein
MELVQRKKIGVVLAGLMAMGLAQGEITPKKAMAPRNRAARGANGPRGRAAMGQKRRARTPRADESGNAAKAANVQAANQPSSSAPPEMVRLTGYLRFGNGTAYATYSNGQRIRRGPSVGRVARNLLKSAAKLV